MRYSRETEDKMAEATKNGYQIFGSGVGFGSRWACRETTLLNRLIKKGYTKFYRIAKTNCRRSGYTKRIIYAAKA